MKLGRKILFYSSLYPLSRNDSLAINCSLLLCTSTWWQHLNTEPFESLQTVPFEFYIRKFVTHSQWLVMGKGKKGERQHARGSSPVGNYCSWAAAKPKQHLPQQGKPGVLPQQNYCSALEFDGRVKTCHLRTHWANDTSESLLQ